MSKTPYLIYGVEFHRRMCVCGVKLGEGGRLAWGGRIWSPAALPCKKMERRRRGRLRHQEEALAAHVAELKTDLSACKDSRAAAKLAR